MSLTSPTATPEQIADLNQLRIVCKQVHFTHTYGVEYLRVIRNICYRLANIVHAHQLDKAGKPYMGHVVRVASKATNVVQECIAVLHDVVEDGEYLGITQYFLREVLHLPETIVNGAIRLTRREGVSYNDYITASEFTFQELKVKLDDMGDNSNLNRFDDANRENMKRCQGYVERIHKLKTSMNYPELLKWEYITDLLAIASCTPLVARVVDTGDGQYQVGRQFNFNFDDRRGREFFLGYLGTVDRVTNQVTGTLFVHTNQYNSNEMIHPRTMVLNFEDVEDCLEYLDRTEQRMAAVPCIRWGSDTKTLVA